MNFFLMILSSRFKFIKIWLFLNFFYLRFLFFFVYIFMYFSILLLYNSYCCSSLLIAEENIAVTGSVIDYPEFPMQYGRPYVQTNLDGFQLSDMWDRLQNERRNIFDRYEPNYLKRSGVSDPANAVAHRWVKIAMAEGTLIQLDEDTYGFTYNRDILFANTVWKPNMNWYGRPMELPQWLQPYVNSFCNFIDPYANLFIKVEKSAVSAVSPYVNVWTVGAFSIIIFVVGTTYVGYLAEQGKFDWLEASQQSIDQQLQERFRLLLESWGITFGTG